MIQAGALWAVKFRARTIPREKCGGPSGTGKVFLLVLLFSLSLSLHQFSTLILLHTEEEQAGIYWEVSNTATLFRMSGELRTEKCPPPPEWTMGWTTGKYKFDSRQ